MSQTSLPEPLVTTKTRTKEETQKRRFPPYNVILENDEYHSAEFVIEVLRKALSCDEQRAFSLMHTAHTTGLAVVWTGPKEVAELKAEQIQTFHETRSADLKLGPLGVRVEAAE